MKNVLRHSGESGNPAVFADKDAGFPPSLDIRGSGDLDLTGLSFIDGVEGGFRVGASFNLDWTGGEQAWRPFPASTWSGLDSLPRSLSIIAGGSLALGPTRFTLAEGTISLTAGGVLAIDNGLVINVGGVIGIPGGTLPIQPGGAITLNGPSPVPEPTTAAMLLAGLAGLAGLVFRRARAER